MALLVKNLPANAGDAENLGSIPGSRRSLGEGKDNPLQYSGLENSVDCIVHGVAKSRTRLSDFHFSYLQHVITFCFNPQMCKQYGNEQSLEITTMIQVGPWTQTQ